MTATRSNVTRDELKRMVRAKPFEPFALSLESGERIILRHPENIAFDPTADGSIRFHVIADDLVTVGTLDAIATISTVDRGQV